MKIVICASEVVPFAKTGGLADVVGVLPLALEKFNQEVIILMPFYKRAAVGKMGFTLLYPDILTTRLGKNIRVYFIQNDKYFDRDSLYGNQKGDYPDNLERFAFFCQRSLELLKQIKFRPDVLHVHDWETAYIPIFLKTKFLSDPFYQNCRTLLTIHNLAFQGLFPSEEFPMLGLDWSLFNMEELEFYGKVNILKGGIVFSDCINTVSPTYAAQIQTKEFGCGLEGVLLKKRDCLSGILNGLDYSIWDPLKDKFIAYRYDVRNLRDKYKNKEELQKECNLKINKKIPLLGMVSRLTEQKGLDILNGAIEEISKLNLQLIILGTGEIKYHHLLNKKSSKFPETFRLYLEFDDTLAHKIYAGSDIFLMPSRYEPCGLGQMISLRYATAPLVYKTGGLADTINEKNGFVFDNYTTSNLVATIKKAISLYQNQEKWQVKIKEGMRADFSWDVSAKKYIQLYKKIVEESEKTARNSPTGQLVGEYGNWSYR